MSRRRLLRWTLLIAVLATAVAIPTGKVLYDRTRKPVAVFTGHIDGFASLAFSPDGKTLAVSGKPGIQLWNVTSHHVTTLTRAHDEQVGFVVFSPDGKTLVSYERRAPAGQPAPARGGERPSRPVRRRSRDGTTAPGHIRLWDVVGRRITATLIPPEGASVVGGVAFSPDGKTLASAGHSNIQLWDVVGRRITATLPERAGSLLAFSPDGKTLAVLNDISVELWDIASRRIIDSFSCQPRRGAGGCGDLAFSPDGRTLAIARLYRGLILWNLADHRNSATFDGYSGSVAFSPDGETLAVGGDSGKLRLWHVASHRNIAIDDLSGDSSSIWPAAFSPDGRTLATVIYHVPPLPPLIISNVNGQGQDPGVRPQSEIRLWRLP